MNASELSDRISTLGRLLEILEACNVLDKETKDRLAYAAANALGKAIVLATD